MSRSLLLNVTFHSKALGLPGDTTDSGTEAEREHDDPETVFLPESKKGLENGVSKGHRTSLKRLLLATLGTTWASKLITMLIDDHLVGYTGICESTRVKISKWGEKNILPYNRASITKVKNE